MVAQKKQIPLVLYAKQSQFRKDSSWMRGFVAGRGSGKSHVGAADVIMRARDGEPWMALSPSYSMIQDTTWPTFKAVAEQLGVWIRGTKASPPRAWFRTQDGGIASIVFRSGDNPDTLRGGSYAGLWCDEASILHSRAFKLAIATLRFRGRMGPCVLTFTPKGKRHWTFEVFYDRIPDNESIQFATEGEKMFALVEDPITGECVRREVVDFGGVPFIRKDNSALFHAHTLENPFLPPEFYGNIRDHYSSALAAQELGGEFVELEGLMFRREWYLDNIVDVVPREAARVRYWDRAATAGGGSYSAGVLVAMDRFGKFYIEDVVRGQWSAMDRDKVIVAAARDDARKYGNEVIIYVEQEGGSGGKEVAQQMVIKLAGFPVYKDIVGGKRHKVKDKLVLPGEAKIVRSMPHQAQAEAGNVYLKRAKWNGDWLEEHAAFPEYAFSDQVDATSGGFNKLAQRGNLDPGAIHRTEIKTSGENKFGVHLIQSRQRRLRGE